MVFELHFYDDPYTFVWPRMKQTRRRKKQQLLTMEHFLLIIFSIQFIFELLLITKLYAIYSAISRTNSHISGFGFFFWFFFFAPFVCFHVKAKPVI